MGLGLGLGGLGDGGGVLRDGFCLRREDVRIGGMVAVGLGVGWMVVVVVVWRVGFVGGIYRKDRSGRGERGRM